ncbi:hypothetical protein [Arthrobacter sp. NA-172]|uniref:hypothetical protein n=1 Tax=Arthrobacter sp. NA-172 TaxID=3367524 RepID=UPI00375471AD
MVHVVVQVSLRSSPFFYGFSSKQHPREDTQVADRELLRLSIKLLRQEGKCPAIQFAATRRARTGIEFGS